MPRRTLEERFWSKVEKTGPDECWHWTGATDNSGYGRIYAYGAMTRATRVSWSIANKRPFPADLYACHRCDNPPCVNPAHIFPGTAKENTQDSVRKGRQYRGGENRDTHCLNGHRWTEETTYLRPNGRRECRACQGIWRRKYNARLNVKHVPAGAMSVTPLHRDEVDGCIVLIRRAGDCWNVVRDQGDCDFIRNTEVQSPGKRRFGIAGFGEDLHFVRVQRIDEELIDRPDPQSEGTK